MEGESSPGAEPVIPKGTPEDRKAEEEKAREEALQKEAARQQSSQTAASPPTQAQRPVTPIQKQTAQPPLQSQAPPIGLEEVRSAQLPPKPKIKFDNYQGTITKMETHHSGLWELDFSLDKPMEFQPGQYVSITFPGMKPAPFSIASSPVDVNNIALGIEIIGKVTTKLSEMRPGEIVPMKGPFGNFTLPAQQRKVCFLAGGIGITPFISMCRWIRDTSPDKHAVLFYSCKSKDQFMWLPELEDMHKNHDAIKVVLTCTREEPEGWSHSMGRINEEMIRKELPDYMDYLFYTCGPPGLINAMFSLMEGMGVPKENIKREAWHG